MRRRGVSAWLGHLADSMCFLRVSVLLSESSWKLFFVRRRGGLASSESFSALSIVVFMRRHGVLATG